MQFETICYRPKKISEINLRTDSRVVIIGTVVDMGQSGFVLADRSGKVEIASEAEVEMGRSVRVFCSVVGEKLKADIVQDLKDFDINLSNRIEQLYKKAGF